MAREDEREDVSLLKKIKGPIMIMVVKNHTHANLNLFWSIRTNHPTARVNTPLPKLSAENTATKPEQKKCFVVFFPRK